MPGIKTTPSTQTACVSPRQILPPPPPPSTHRARRWRRRAPERRRTRGPLTSASRGAREQRYGARDHVLARQRRDSHHRQAAVLELAELLLLQVEAGLLGELQGVPAEVARLAVHLADPRVLWEELALHERDEDGDLHHAEAANRVGIASIQSLPIVRLLWLTRDLEEGLSHHADKRQHAHAAVLDLSLTQPLHVRVCHDHVEVEVPVEQLCEAQRVPNLAVVDLRAGTHHGLQSLLAAGHRGAVFVDEVDTILVDRVLGNSPGRGAAAAPRQRRAGGRREGARARRPAERGAALPARRLRTRG